MNASDAILAAQSAAKDPAITDTHRERARELMGLALGAGLTGEQSAALIAAKLAEWDARATELATLTRRLFTYLDIVEESDEGREFHPVSFGCCRAMWVEDLNWIMAEMKRLSAEQPTGDTPA